MQTHTVRLVIRRSAPESNVYEARWTDSDGQSSNPFPLEPPLSSDDAADLRWYLERYHEFVGNAADV